MMINKRLLGTVKESKNYIAGNVVCQWVSLAANITMMGAIACLLQKLYEGSADGKQISITAIIAVVAVVIRFLCATLASRMGYLSSKAVKKALREKIREVMRFSGPRMIFHHPVQALRHVIESKKEKKRLEEHKLSVKKILYIILGCIGVGLGAVGAVVPMLPAFPFLMLAAFCFARSSEKLDRWFKGTKLYKDNLEDFVAGRGMIWNTKIRIMITVTVLMSIGFIMMGTKGIVVGCIVLGCAWVFHILYFCFGVKTIPVQSSDAQ